MRLKRRISHKQLILNILDVIWPSFTNRIKRIIFPFGDLGFQVLTQ